MSRERHMPAIAAIAIAAGICIMPTTSLAASPVSVSGFATIGAVYNDTNKAEFIRDLSQPAGVAGGWGTTPDSLVGLQISYQPSKSFELVAQAVSRYNYDSSYRPHLAWAFVKYAPTPGLVLRGGRLGWDVYMLADSRSVGYSYLWVRPPMEYFGTLQLSHIDGADLVARHNFGDTVVSLKLYGGRADERLPVADDVILDLTGSDVYGGYVNAQTRHWQLRFGASTVRFEHEIPSQISSLFDYLRATGDPAAIKLARDLSLAGKKLRHYNAGVVYENGPLQSQWMYDFSTTDSRLLPDHQSALWLLSYRVGAWTPYAVLTGTWLHNFNGNTGLSAFNPLTGAAATLLSTTRLEQQSLGLGVRYDFMPKADLKLQIDRIHSHHHPQFWRHVKAGWDGNTVVFSAAIDFIF